MTETDLPDENIILKFLIETGCCKRCALRFVGKGEINFDNPSDDPLLILSENLNHCGDERVFKKSKLNPCIICLDLLQDVTLQSMVQSPEIEKVSEYDCDTFLNFISFPKAIYIREHSVEILVKEKFPQFFEDRHIVPLNRAWALSIQNKLAERLEKKVDRNSNLKIQFNTSYELEQEESSVICNSEDKQKKFNGHNDAISARNVIDSLKTIASDSFKQIASVPPTVPRKTVFLQEVIFKHDHIFIAGRYCKYARNLFQTPWTADDMQEVVVTSSVQEIIFESLSEIFNCSTLVFSSSGREDFDVRTLGRGRPFFIKISDPKVTKIPFEKFREIEESIQQTKVLKVRDLQFIDRRYINNIKEGEQFKKKTYRALCIIDKPEKVMSYIDKINGISTIKLQQKTPLRVYHRRSSDNRERKIYCLKAKPVPDRNNLFELIMVTQAGTYVKEFVHGDLGRTTPSLSEIIGGYVDIIALDVLDIHLDFPPRLDEKIDLEKMVL